jgi:hypothetical protein
LNYAQHTRSNNLPYSSIYTYLQEAFTPCLQKNTHATESGLTVSVAKKKNEIILFVQADNDHARRYLEMPQGNKKSCDRLILYALDYSKDELLCFLELKGNKLDDAVDQIINTHKHMRILLNKNIAKKQHIFLCACICTHNSVPNVRNQQSHLEKLKNFLGIDKVRIVHRTNRYDIGVFLRDTYPVQPKSDKSFQSSNW